MVDARHRLRAADARAARAAAPLDPEVGGGLRQHEGRQPRAAARPLAAHRVRDGLQPRPAPVRRAASACRPFRARSARFRLRGARRRSAASPGDDARRGHRPDASAIGRAGLARRLRRARRAWTEAPSTLRRLSGASATAGATGTLQSVWKHRAALWRARRARDRPPRRCRTSSSSRSSLPLFAPLIDLFFDLRHRLPRPRGRCSASGASSPSLQLAARLVRIPARRRVARGCSGRCRSSSSSTGS